MTHATGENCQSHHYVEIEEVSLSQLPFRLIRKRDGVNLGSYETREAALEQLANLKESNYNPKRTQGPRRY